MAQIPRPPKQGNVMTYVAKVAAGYPHILAGEMDADLDTIYGAWNGGADTVNIRDGAITSAKLADGAVTDPKIVSVAWAKVTGAPIGPGGVAGGDLSGTYPNPAIRDGAVTAAKLAPGAVGGTALAAGSVGATQIADGSVGTVELADAAVTRAKLAPGALPGNVASVAITSFATSTVGSWVPVIALPTLTTRGANPVFLFTNHGLIGACLAGPGTVMVRWTRDGAQLCSAAYAPNGAATFPVPSLPWCDLVPAAGSYVYRLDVYLGTGASAVQFSAGATGCGLAAVEIG